MKLHANAALSLNKQRVLAKRIVEVDWSLTKAAAVAEVSERTAGKWARRYRADGELGLLDHFRLRETSRTEPRSAGRS